MSRRSVVLLAAALLALAAACLLAGTRATGYSSASYTTSSQSDLKASADTASNWVHLYSQGSDPNGATIYARKRLINGGVGTVAATGQDGTLAVDLGGFPDKNKTFPFVTVFSLVAPANFPDPAVTQVTVSATLVADVADQPLTLPGFTPFGPTGGGPASVTLGRGQKYQFNVTVKTRKKFTLGRTYYPHVLINLTVPGVPAGYFRYDIPISVTDIGGS
jgi:hypothetical protein